MSNVSFMEKLLGGVEVKWKALGGVAEYSQTRVDSSGLNAASFVGVDNLVADKGGRVDATYMPNTERLTAYETGDILLGNIRPYLKKVWKATSSGGCSGDVLAVRISENFKRIVSSDYLYYLLSSDEFFSYNMQHAKGAKMPRGNKAAILNYKIPIPCPDNPKKSLEVQAEIVRILDTFTELTTELTAELTARKKQYNYYRDQLLSFEEGEVEWKTLGEITRVSSASRVHKNEWTTSGVPFFRTSDVISIFNGVKNSRDDAFISNELYETLSSKSGKTQKNDILVTGGGTIGIPYIVPNDEPLYFKDADLLCIKKSKTFNSKFLYHYFLTTKFRIYLENISHNSTIAHYTISQIKKTPIPVPPLEEQTRIVAILDKFDALTSSITEGLPREIELRQQQYEYYRDLLLSFPESRKPKPDAEVAA